MKVYYKKGYKYQLAKRYVGRIDIKPPEDIANEYIALSKNGVLVIKKGYAWDGATYFPDIIILIRISLVHDALYQFLREGLLSPSYREEADGVLKKMCRENGMNRITTWIVYKGVRIFASYAANPRNKKKVFTAP